MTLSRIISGCAVHREIGLWCPVGLNIALSFPRRRHDRAHYFTPALGPSMPRIADTRQSPDRLQLPWDTTPAWSAHTLGRVHAEARTFAHPLRISLHLSSSREADVDFRARIDRLHLPHLRHRDFQIPKRHWARNGLMTSHRQLWEDLKCGGSERGADCN